MNKAELVEAIANGAGLSKTLADAALSATLTAIKTEMGKGNDVSLIGFGSFKVGKRAARMGRNPQTGKPQKIAARKVAKFSPGAELKAIVNGEKKAASAKKAAPAKKAAAKKKK
ncbi:MAG: HU family DNA-binding protein [Chlorobi bacterium]|nr:MAG: HU family DNA-binding protein [Bacteroidota bacterium]KXK33731.1 MAG: histone family protein DNA-binding protein [Chlorobi bacterium OLB6]MBE2266103.1 HU family DNA-binding protein [Flavobacteriales bacterium]MBL1160675.1 HU family DNA-binding protein [Chlorobiota bacterium]MBW7853026.1 HU family DNA-binding protein [Candidatus Kapabacteria bacterium]MCC6331485.1 HU family DNA-binding protein [Ignavibacteria bacterium]